MNHHLLPELQDSTADLLPLNTRVFPTTGRVRRQFYALTATPAILFPILLALTIAVGITSDAARVLLVFIAILLVGTLGPAAYFYRTDTRAYEQKLKDKLWMYGVIIFPTGDLVVRDTSPWSQTNVSIDSSCLTGMTIRHRPAFCGCKSDTELLISYFDPPTGEERSVLVLDSSLVDSVHTIKEYAEHKRRRDQAPL